MATQANKTHIVHVFDNGDKVDGLIDNVIVNMVQEIWKAGVCTKQQSVGQEIWKGDVCKMQQSVDPFVHLQFQSSDYTKFMSILADFTDPRDETQLKMYNKIMHGDDFITRFNLHDRNIFMKDLAADFGEDIANGKYKHPIPAIDINCNLWFKLELIDDILAKFVLYNNVNRAKPATEVLTFQWTHSDGKNLI